MTEKTLTTENIKPALDALRGELAPWPVVAKKQDRLNTAQLNAANSGITSSLVAQIIANTAAIRALESAITGTGLRALVVATLPAIGTQGILYIVPVTTYDPETDADVVNYSNEYIWIPVEGGAASEGHYEQVGQTGIVINNGQLTITVNGTSVGTFTANQSGDTTAAITVPTNADYVDLSTNQTVAGVKTFSSTINGTASKAIADEDGTSIKTGYGKLAGNQTWTGVNTFNSAPSIKGYASIINDSMTLGTVPSSTLYNGYWFKGSTSDLIGSTDIEWYSSGNSAIVTRLTRNTAGASREIVYSFVFPQTGNGTFSVYGDCTPSVTNTYALGSSSYQWSSVYAQTYYYKGTQWGLDKANVWTNTNTFQQNVTYERTNFYHQSVNPSYILKDTGLEKGSLVPTAHTAYPGLWHDKNNAILGYMRFVAYDTGKQTAEIRVSNLIKNGALDPTGSTINCTVNLELQPSGEKSLIPEQNNDINLGTSTNKWKTLNGINPGALSLPDLNNTVDITSTFNSAIDKTQNLNSYTADFTGWLFVIWWAEGLTAPYYIYFYCTNSASDSDLRHAVWGQTFNMSNGVYFICTVIPVISGKTYWFETSFTRTSTDTRNLAYSVRKLPCLGNV